jgi:DNA-binding response OmpR family regulator
VQAITAERQEDEDSKFHDGLLIASEKDELVDADKDDEKRATILIVEDNADVRSYIRSHFEDHYDLLEADDGEKGLQMAQGGDADLILADVMMPNMDGYEMCRLIKANEKLRHIPVIMLTAKATSTETLEGLGSGADDYITKPFKMPELLAKVENLIATRREMRARFSREILVRPADITISPDEEVFLDRIIEAVNHHIGDSNFTTDWLADEVGLSRRQLDRRVLAVTGETASELTRRMRMERASQLLRARVGTVSEVAYAVGFRSPAHFSRVFRQAFGMAPSDLTTGDSVPNPVD